MTFVVGGLWELLFAVVRKHELNEGFLVTGMLFPLILPPAIPLWQVALGISFGVVVGKEIFGGTGMNVLNPALVARAFVFFAYPAEMSGDAVWIAADTSTDAVSGATALATATLGGTAAMVAETDGWSAFVGFVPGSLGETSALACLLGRGAAGRHRRRLLAHHAEPGRRHRRHGGGAQRHRVGDQPVLRRFAGVAPAARRLGVRHRLHGHRPGVGPRRALRGHYVYGFLIGVLCVLIRVVNPAYPEGMMLAILFMNLFAPLIDYFAIQANVRRRRARYASAP